MTRLSRWLSLYGPLLLALYFVTTTRWGGYLLPGPPYVGDIALAGLIAHRLWTLARFSTPEPLLSRAIVVPAALLLLVSILVFALGEWTVTALRDGAPYLYAVLVFFGQSYRSVPTLTTERLIYGALVLHSLWFGVGELFPALYPEVATPGSGEVLLLGGRGDVDGALVGILAALALDRTVMGRTPLPSALTAAWALTVILANQSRAGLLASVCALGFIAIRYVVLWRAALAPRPADAKRRPRCSWSPLDGPGSRRVGDRARAGGDGGGGRATSVVRAVGQLLHRRR